ncbi:MAG: glycosyltransferase family 2 protein [Cyclobacteriaceae bacterium]
MVPLISIVIPTFNRAHTLIGTIDSIVAQNFDKWELIVVDDGSTDNTSVVLYEYIQKDSRITYLIRPQNKPKGANSCRNFGVQNARGDYIAFLDSDDQWKQSKLEADWELLNQKTNVKGIYSGIIIDNGKFREAKNTRPLHSDESYVDFIFSKGVMAQTSTYMVDSHAVKKIMFDEKLQRHQDLDFFIRFGKEFSWEFLDGCNTIVNWKKGEESKPHFPSMIRFYEKYRTDITSKKNHARYLIWAWVQAKKNNQEYTDYYIRQLKEMFFQVSFEDKLFCLAPNVFYLGWNIFDRIKRNLLSK